MGINIVAIFPIKTTGSKMMNLIALIEQNKIAELDIHGNALREEGFAETGISSPQWYDGPEKINQKPKEPSINAALEIPQGLVFRFTETAIVVYSLMRAFLFFDGNPKSKASLIEIFRKIGKLIQAEECWLMGDNNPIYYSFIEGLDYEKVAECLVAHKELDAIYRLTGHEGTYEIEGYYRMGIA